MWDEIQKFGPSENPIDVNDPSDIKRIEFVEKEFGLNRQKAIEYLDKRLMGDFARRGYFTKNYGWSVPSKKAINELKAFIGNDEVLEVASGYGMWAKLMQDAGIKVRATDLVKSPHFKVYNPSKKAFTDIEDLSHGDALEKYSSHKVLMMSWPPYDCSLAYETIRSFKGNKLIFVGESKGGCTANDDFFKELNKNWKFIKDIDIPQWAGIHDYLFLYVRK